MKSTLHVTNDLVISPLLVTPVLWLSNGTKYVLPAMNLAPSGTAIVNINQALADQGVAPYATLSGYVELDYQWPWDALCATVVNVDVAHSVIFNYGLQIASASAPVTQSPAPTQPLTQTLEGLWWKQEADVSGFVALTNPGPQAISASVVSSDAQGNALSQHSVTVSPHGTKMVDLAELPQTAGAAGGLRVVYDGAPDNLLVLGGLRDDATGYSANISLAPPPTVTAQVSTVSYAEIGLLTGAADPMLAFPAGTVFTPYAVLRNISSQPVTFTPNLWWMAGGAALNAPLPAVSIAPYQAMNLDVMSLLAQAGLKNYNGSVSLVLDVSAKSPRGAVLISSGSVDQKNTYVFQVAPEAAKESIAKNISYWSTANGDDTMVTLWNPADEEQDFLFTLFYSGGHYKYPLHLGPRATSMFNISEILHSAIPDAEGNIIPTGIYEGSAELSGSQGEVQHILVTMDASTYNVVKATCGAYCKTCQGAADAWVYQDPFVLPFNATHQLTFTVQNHSGTQVDDTSAAGWSSSDTNVATVNGGLVTSVAVGTLNANVFDDSFPLYSTGCYAYAVECPVATGIGSSAPGNATPVITSIDPDVVLVGSTIPQVTINGSGFGSSTSPTVNLPQGVAVAGGLGSTDTQIILKNVTVSINAPIGPNSITVTVKAADGTSETSNQGPFTLDGPFYMTVVADQLIKCTGPPACQTTVERDVTYQIMNFSNTSAGATKIGESAMFTGWNCNQANPGASTLSCSAGYSTPSTGRFTDGWSLNSDSYTPVGCGQNVDDHWLWCPTGQSIGHLSGYSHTNAISIKGVVNPPYTFTAGTVINP